jgi:hypothetical protein
MDTVTRGELSPSGVVLKRHWPHRRISIFWHADRDDACKIFAAFDGIRTVLDSVDSTCYIGNLVDAPDGSWRKNGSEWVLHDDDELLASSFVCNSLTASTVPVGMAESDAGTEVRGKDDAVVASSLECSSLSPRSRLLSSPTLPEPGSEPPIDPDAKAEVRADFSPMSSRAWPEPGSEPSIDLDVLAEVREVELADRGTQADLPPPEPVEPRLAMPTDLTTRGAKIFLAVAAHRESQKRRSSKTMDSCADGGAEERRPAACALSATEESDSPPVTAKASRDTNWQQSGRVRATVASIETRVSNDLAGN